MFEEIELVTKVFRNGKLVKIEDWKGSKRNILHSLKNEDTVDFQDAFPANTCVLNFLGGEDPLCVYCIGSCFLGGFQWKTKKNFSPVIMLEENDLVNS